MWHLPIVPGVNHLDAERALRRSYFIRFPDGREPQSWPGLVYVRVRPTWIRYSNYSRTPPEIIEFDPASPT